jgi:phospholipase C
LGAAGEEFNLLNASDPTSRRVYVGKGAKYCTPKDPLHDFMDTGFQVFAPGAPPQGGSGEPTMGGFAANYATWGGDPQDVMNCYTPDQVPVISALAQSFHTCTRSFAAVPGPTGPNRMFVHTGSSAGYDGDNYYNYPINATSIYDLLDAANVSWAIHFHDFTTAHGIYPTNTHAANFVQDVGFARFLQQVATGTQPAYTFLVPQLGRMNGSEIPTSQHPVFDVRPGEQLIKTVYEALRASPAWNDTLLILTYDEHGGFWDSVSPPAAVNPWPDRLPTPFPFDFGRLGVRVPTILVSPRLATNLDDTLYDTSSVPATVAKIFGVPVEPLGARAAAANTFEAFFLDPPRTDAPTTLPAPPSSPPICPKPPGLHGLHAEAAEMYEQLLRWRGVQHRMTRRLEDVVDDDSATAFSLEAIALLSAA